jgi:hypothetical protein
MSDAANQPAAYAPRNTTNGDPFQAETPGLFVTIPVAGVISKRFQAITAGRRIMAGNLKGKHVAIVATDGFEQSELTQPLDALRAAGATMDVVSPKDGAIQGMQHHDKGDGLSP